MGLGNVFKVKEGRGVGLEEEGWGLGCIDRVAKALETKGERRSKRKSPAHWPGLTVTMRVSVSVGGKSAFGFSSSSAAVRAAISWTS